MEKSHTVNGVKGCLWVIKNPNVRAVGCLDAQKWVSESRPVSGYGKGAYIRAEIRFDDQCKNGHNSFAITADVTVPGNLGGGAGGCLHDDIAAVFPELAPLIKWHLCATDGPMHYLANTLYHAGDTDCRGKRKGEPDTWEHGVTFAGVPIVHTIKTNFWKWLQTNRAGTWGQTDFDFAVLPVAHEKRAGDSYDFKPKFTFGGFDTPWYSCPFDNEREALDFLQALQKHNPEFVTVATSWSTGKEREFNFARSGAVWPDATDAELCLPREELKTLLEARLPGLITAMRADIESIGFIWDAGSETI